ncbi:hypothetical protein BJ322DRAFT_337069 [Thelephora terrestris]|uniref:BHLH domain-containing protein n=1 Tax=Thelephora terrestris TaxID=56493 RepID=A0A9P6L2C8_9AGAM|nr:hypothetical protein BJ322DRAFT_337069 [Thelephora terrestris]
MAFYDHEADFNHYPTTTSAAVRLDERPFLLNQPPVVDQFSGPAHEIPADRWGMATQQGPAFGSQPSLPGGAGFNSVAEATLFDGYSQPSLTNRCWPAQSQQPYLSRVGSSDWGAFPTRTTMAPGPSRIIPTPINVPLCDWGANQSGPSTSTFDWNVPTTNQSMSGPSRTGQSSTRRFQPYGTSRAREPEQRNAEAGPSTITLPQVAYVGSPTPEPTGGLIPEAKADANNEQPFTEEEEAPKQRCRRKRLPNGEGVPRGGRKREQSDFRKLGDFVQHWKNLPSRPTNAEALWEAREYIRTIRTEVYMHPRLKTGVVQPCPEDNEHAKIEWERRNVERTLMGELSQYYQVPGDNLVTRGQKSQKDWVRPALLKEVLEDLQVRYPPPPPVSNEPDPQTSALEGGFLVNTE